MELSQQTTIQSLSNSVRAYLPSQRKAVFLKFQYDTEIDHLSISLNHDNISSQFVFKSPVLSIGHQEFKSRDIHFIFESTPNDKESKILVINCGLHPPEVSFLVKNEHNYAEKRLIINHETQGQINRFLESLPIMQDEITSTLFPVSLLRGS